jgi:hypothetical protein
MVECPQRREAGQTRISPAHLGNRWNTGFAATVVDEHQQLRRLVDLLAGAQERRHDGGRDGIFLIHLLVARTIPRRVGVGRWQIPSRRHRAVIRALLR